MMCTCVSILAIFIVVVGNTLETKGFVESESRNFFDLVAVDIDDNIVSLKDFEGKVILVVNVASECGYTDGHYRALVSLQRKLAPDGKFTVLAFPCNQFGKQEPGKNKEIKDFVEKTYNVNFPMFSKVNVIEDNVPDVWSYLIDQAKTVPNWNFWKYLVDQEGRVVHAWGPWVSVEEVTPHIMELLEQGRSREYSDEL